MRTLWVVALVALVGLSGCDRGPKSALGFALPDGSAEQGRDEFVQLQCNSCHVVVGLELPEPATRGPVIVKLGGQVGRIKTYGELVTSIINPSHKIAGAYPAAVSRDGESLMRVYNEVMTVQQLIDLVAFLQSHYELIVPQYNYPAF